jgi:hypothetical protein
VVEEKENGAEHEIVRRREAKYELLQRYYISFFYERVRRGKEGGEE